MKSAFLLLAATLPAMTQSLSFGVRGGVPLTDFFQSVNSGSASYVSETHRFTVGPTVELHLPLGLSVEADALYRSVGYRYNQLGASASASGSAWQFPLLARLSFLPGPIKPFIDGGATFQRTTSLDLLGVLTQPASSTLGGKFSSGFTFGAGVQVKLLRFRVEPEFRYTRWGANVFNNPALTALSTNQNQGDFLVGITF